MLRGYRLINPTVKAMGELEISGHVIPLSWFQYIVHDERKKRKDAKKGGLSKKANASPDMVAIMILADLVYWYRPIKPRDQMTGKALPWRQKFKADLMQRTYQSYAEQFGFTIRQCKEAMYRLQEMGLVKIVIRNFITTNGVKLGNVTFFGLNFEKIKSITMAPREENVSNEKERQNTPPYTSGCVTLIHQDVQGYTSGCVTNTKTSTKIINTKTSKKEENFSNFSFSTKKKLSDLKTKVRNTALTYSSQPLPPSCQRLKAVSFYPLWKEENPGPPRLSVEMEELVGTFNPEEYLLCHGYSDQWEILTRAWFYRQQEILNNPSLLLLKNKRLQKLLKEQDLHTQEKV